jgi:type I restriction enzyme, S subunit
MAANVEWPTKRLGELAEFRNGVNYNKSSFGEGIKVVGVSNFQDYTKPRYAELEQINPEGIVTERNILRDGDVVFVRSNGNRELIGRSLFIEQPPEQVTHSAFTIRLRFSSREVHPKFYAYCFRTPLIRKGLTAYGGGTNISNLNQDILSALEVPFPPLPVQRRIAGILSAYDDLIENNQRRIRILEEMARALYREWFVHFRFPGHETVPHVPSPLGPIPQGWKVKKLNEIAEVNRAQINPRAAPDELHYIDISSVSPGQIDAITTYTFADAPGRARRIVQHGDVLWSCVRPNRRSHALVMQPEPNTIASTGFAVLTATKVPFPFLYFVTTTDDFVGYLTNNATGAAYPAVTTATFEKADLLIPPAPLLKKFDDATIPMAEQIHTLQHRTQNLRRTRDLLLPRLLSGQTVLSSANDSPEDAIEPKSNR